MPIPITTVVDVTINVAPSAGPKFEFGPLMGIFTHSVTANRQDGPYFSVADLNDAGFDFATTPTINAWGTTVFSQGNGVDSVMIGRVDAGDANYTATMDAIEAAGEDTWYQHNIESRVDADIALVATWTESRFHFFTAQSDDKTGVAMTAAQAANQVRTMVCYHALDAEYLDGGISSISAGFNLDVPNGVGVWFGKVPAGVTPDNLTTTEVTTRFALNGNVFVGGGPTGIIQPFYSEGKMGEGRFADITTTIDWLQKRVEEATLNLLLGTPTKIPFTQSGIHQVVTQINGVLLDGVSFGHFAPNPAPVLIEPLISNISAADKQNRNLTLTATATIAGAIQKVTITFNLSL